MRNLTSDALDRIAERLGNEPINIISVQWSIGGPIISYADRAIDSIPGKILDLDTLDSVVNVSGNGNSQEIRVALDDTDGSLKAILDANDIHQRSVWVYQTFDGLDMGDKFLLFKGQVSSPITYSEGERKLTFNVVSKIEDKEIGFSAEEGKFDFVADDLIGTAWPMCFGTVIQGKTLKLTGVYKGILAKSFGVPDFALPYRRDVLAIISGFWQTGSVAYGGAAEKHRVMAEYYSGRVVTLNGLIAGLNPMIPAQATQIAAYQKQVSVLQQLVTDETNVYHSHLQNSEQFHAQAVNYSRGSQTTSAIYNRQVAALPATIRIVGGEKFPRGNIELKIAECRLKGHFIGTTNEFQIVQAIHPKAPFFFASRVPMETGVVGVPMALSPAGYVIGNTFFTLVTSGTAIGTVSSHTVTVGNLNNYTLSAGGGVASGDTFIIINQAPFVSSSGNGALEIHQLPGTRITSVSTPDTRTIPPPPDVAHPEIPDPSQVSLPLDFFLFDSFPPNLLSQYSLQMFGDNAGYIFNEAGSVVEMYTPEGQEYIVSIVPGTVLQVSAFLTKNGVKKLVTVPAEYYTAESHDYGGITAVRLILTDALSKNTVGGEWGDELYVTFQSSVGPNTVDVLEYLIDEYTVLGVDSDSFDDVRTALENYPSHFQITERKNIIQALSEIAWQARCAIWLDNDVFYLRYLPAEPESVSTFTDEDVDFGTMECSFTPTEDICTKMVCKWRATGAQPNDNTAILRYNVKKYGTKEQDFNFYIYNKVDFVIKSATFWLIRKANTWKKIKFQTPLQKLNVESLDGVTLDFTKPWLASAPVVGIVERANYNSDSQQLDFEIWTPVRAGDMTQYDFAYPAGIDTELKFPTNADEALEFDGGDGPGRNVGEGENLGIPGNFTTDYENPDFYKLLNRRFNDRGQLHPSDANDGTPGAVTLSGTPSLEYTGAGPASPVTSNTTPQVPVAPRPESQLQSAAADALLIRFDTPLLDDLTDPDNPVTTTLAEILLYDTDLELHGARVAFFAED